MIELLEKLVAVDVYEIDLEKLLEGVVDLGTTYHGLYENLMVLKHGHLLGSELSVLSLLEMVG